MKNSAVGRGIRWCLNHIKVRTKLLLILVLAMALVFLSVLTTFRIPYKAYDEKLYTSSVQMITLFADKIQSELEDIEELSYRILSDNVLQKNLSVMRVTSPGTVAWVEAKSEVADRMSNFAIWFTSASTLQLKTVMGTAYRQTFGNTSTDDELTSERIQYATGRSGREVWLAEGGDPARLFLLREVREIEGFTLLPLATMLIEMDLTGLVEAYRAMMGRLGVTLSCAIYTDDICLYASDDQVRGMGMGGEDGYEYMSLDGQDMLCVRFTAANGWRYVTLVDYSVINATIRDAEALSLGIDIAAMVLALAIGVVLIQSLLRHLRTLLEKFDAFARSGEVADEDTSPYRDQQDEIGQLHRHFDTMAHDYHDMMRRGYEQQQILQEKQMQQLRAQVQPHFLYNVLESIYCLAKQDKNERISEMTDALGKMLRASLNDKRDVVTIAEDLQTAREYLRIQLIRYGSRLQVVYEVDERVLGCQIPAMTLQPLVDNAVHHAVEEMLDTCVIRVRGEITETGIDMTIEDNGPGMDEDILDRLERGEVKPGGMGIGMRNIHQRVRYAFGDAYGLAVRSRPGETRVIVRLPDTRKGETDV